MSIHDQIQRVKEKIPLARAATNSMEVFGASSHKYQLNDPLSESEISQFEQMNGITLPEGFRLFLTEVGNGGAGPYYGIYKLDLNETQPYLSRPCKMRPDMTDEEWEELTNDDEEDEDEDFYEETFQGMLNIGTQGCSYEMMLIVTGPQKGRVIYTDWYTSKPFFTYEAHFLDWYERWLDEVIGGYTVSWFGCNMGGDDQELIRKFQISNDEEFKEQALSGMLKLPKLADTTIDFLEEQWYHGTKGLRSIALSLLVKHSYHRSKPFLQQLITSEDENGRLVSLKYIFWYAKGYEEDWVKEIRIMLTTNENPEIERFAGYVLERVEKHEG